MRPAGEPQPKVRRRRQGKKSAAGVEGEGIEEPMGQQPKPGKAKGQGKGKAKAKEPEPTPALPVADSDKIQLSEASKDSAVIGPSEGGKGVGLPVAIDKGAKSVAANSIPEGDRDDPMEGGQASEAANDGVGGVLEGASRTPMDVAGIVPEGVRGSVPVCSSSQMEGVQLPQAAKHAARPLPVGNDDQMQGVQASRAAQADAGDVFGVRCQTLGLVKLLDLT